MGSLTVRSKTNLKETELTYWQVGKCRISSRNITTTKTTSSQDTQQLPRFWLQVTMLCFPFFVQAPLTFSFQMWLERIPVRKYFTSSPEIHEKKSPKTWSDKLTLNIKKSNFVATNTHACLELKNLVKYIGILINSDLSWKHHTDYICH